MFSGLLGLHSIKLLYFTAYVFKFGPFLQTNFCVLPNQWLKIEVLSNSINVRLVPCLVE